MVVNEELSVGEVSAEDIGNVLTSLTRRLDAELLATPESGLEQLWHFRWEETASVEWNTYKFSDMLERYKRSCRRWEEHHNGNSCVVERVRDKYLMPKVREFLADLAKHTSRQKAVRNLNKKEQSVFQVGDVVRWTGQEGETKVDRIGTVVQVVPIGSRPDPERFRDLRSSVGYGREVVSYVVRAKNKCYWPRASALTREIG